ncbi:MAG: NAD(P)H-dependent oxidoreductase [Chitinophagaceae bacterium]
MYKVKIITSSTRPGRKGPAVAAWIQELAAQHEGLEVELLDVAAINLPFMDEPNHPRLKQYTHDHTKKWSKLIEEADAFLFVTTEYNFGYPAPLKNAIDFLYHEWGYKPVGFVSYGGLSGGTRAVQQLKQVVTALKMVPLVEAVHIPFFSKFLNDEEKFLPDEGNIKTAGAMIAELAKWAETLKTMRNK